MSRRSHSRESRQKPASTTLGITSLGIDVLINLIKYLRPCDILSLRKTSRFFHSVTKHRTVWLNALRGVMHKHFITKATYPLESMSLPLLEHAALSPYKFASLVERSPSSGIKPTSIRILSPLLTKAEKDRYGIIGFGAVDDIIFCPGGRYLATVSLFDGEATKALITSSLNLNFRFSAHNITISSRIPEFVEVAHIDLPSYSSLKSFHLASERLIFTALVEDSGGPSSVLVWDFMNQSAVLWNLPASVIDTDAIIASSNEDSIIVAALGQFWIFNVPPLISYTIATITSTPHEPSLALPRPLPTQIYRDISATSTEKSLFLRKSEAQALPETL
ncbi:hypothetical protein BDZ97DRAFT_1830849 [Flammula alnicola]|nr:hypothetical protein BDZ97DRAFT_1830849 [Flammula alnicola]